MAENKKIVVVNLQKLEVAPIGAGGAEGSVFEEVPVVMRTPSLMRMKIRRLRITKM